LLRDRECWYVDRKCANDTRPHLLTGNKKRWINKYMSAEATLEARPTPTPAPGGPAVLPN
jgi:hypothetical protein